MPSKKIFKKYNKNTEQKSNYWCIAIINVCFSIIAVNYIAHAVWFFLASELIIASAKIYMIEHFLITPAFMIITNIIAYYIVKSNKFSIDLKQYTVLYLLLFFCFMLCFMHKYTTILLSSYILPVVASTVFAEIKVTRRIFLFSLAGILISGIKLYKPLSENLGGRIWMELITAIALLFCAYLICKVLINYLHDNITNLLNSYFDKKNMQEQLKKDLFTGLYNRKTFDELLPELMEECINSNSCLSLAIIDVDDFKVINDTYGHSVGDRVLLKLSRILRNNQNQNIQVFRIGGEEFAILLKGYCVNDAYIICEDIRTFMESYSLSEISDNKVTFSCGLACMNKINIEAVDFFNAADTALYCAKSNGKNQTMIYDGHTVCIKAPIS